MQNIDSDLIRGNIDTIILKTMLSGDMYGLDIIKEVENKSNGTYELKQPTLYSCLKRLENQELISSYWKESDIGGKRHYYKLTEKGHEELSKKQEEWSKSKFIIDNLLGEHSDEYRLVKKNDYDKIIEGKKFEYSEEDQTSPEASDDSENENTKIVYVPKSEEIIESESVSSADEPVYVDQAENDHLSINSSASYDEDADKYKSQENNILYNLRNQDADIINEYFGDKKSYVSQVKITNVPEQNENDEANIVEPEPESVENDDEPEFVQQNLLDLENNNNSDEIDQTISEFEENIAKLNNFKMRGGTEVEETETEEEVSEEDSFDFDSAFSYDGEDNSENFSVLPENNEEPEEEISYESNPSYNNFLDELNELGANGYTNEYHASDDENQRFLKPSPANLPLSDNRYQNTVSFNEPKQTETFVEETVEETPVYSEPETYETAEISEPAPIEHIESDDELWNSWNKEEDNYNYNNFDPVSNDYQTSQTSFEDIIFRNNTQSEPCEPKYATFAKTSENEPYKQKLQNLGAYSKVTIQKSNGLDKAKDISSLKEEFEKEGIKVTEFKKEEIAESDRNYLLINKLNIIKSFILLFGYVFILSALYLILGSTGFKNTTGFSFICFLYGFIPFGVYAIFSTVMFLLNPYKKVPAKYAVGIMFFISAIVTIQLLLITYCVNLQMGFYSFAQAGYNHLNWIVPLVCSFAPLISTGIHTALFYSRNFNV